MILKLTTAFAFIRMPKTLTMEVLKMKKLAIVLVCLALVITFSSQVMAKGGKNSGCTTIQSGELLASDGSLIETGYDQ